MENEIIGMQLFRQETGKPLGRAELKSILKNFSVKGYVLKLVFCEKKDTWWVELEPKK